MYLIILLTGLASRIRGGWLREYTPFIPGNVFWGVYILGLTGFLTLSYWSIAAGVLAWATFQWFGHGKWFTMGRNTNQVITDEGYGTRLIAKIAGLNSFKADMIGMSLIGIFRTSWALIFVAQGHIMFLPIFFSGALQGVAYELGWRTPSKVKGFWQGTEMGELYFGLFVGLGFLFI